MATASRELLKLVLAALTLAAAFLHEPNVRVVELARANGTGKSESERHTTDEHVGIGRDLREKSK